MGGRVKISEINILKGCSNPSQYELYFSLLLGQVLAAEKWCNRDWSDLESFREKNNFGHKELQLSSTNSQFRQWTVCKFGKNWIYMLSFWYGIFSLPTSYKGWQNWSRWISMLFFGMGIFFTSYIRGSWTNITHFGVPKTPLQSPSKDTWLFNDGIRNNHHFSYVV